MMKREVLWCWIIIAACALLSTSTSVAFPPSAALYTLTGLTDSSYHYEPVPGKTIGVFPYDWSLQWMSYLRTQYGFSGVFVGADLTQYNNALQAGFSPANIMVGISIDSYIYAVKNLPAGFYYIDEAVEHDCYGHPTAARLYTTQELATCGDTVHYYRPGAKFVIGGYKRCSHNRIAATYADLIMYSSYKNWDDFGLPICHVNLGWGDEWEDPWIPGSDDQRTSWTSMRQTFGTKYSITWIHGGGDEYDLLFPHANTLGLTGLWQYNGALPDSARLESFCTAAWQNGWLIRVPNTPLPIQLVSFTGAFVTQTSVLLRWRTLTELNIYGFEVQRRAPTQSSFASLPNSFVPGHGTTVEPHDYEYLDTTAWSDHWFYRLKVMSLDGSLSYSEAIQVHVVTSVGEGQPDKFEMLQNYPNPFNPATTIIFSVREKSFVRLAVYNTLAKEIDVLVAQVLTPGRYSVGWDASDFSSGVYFCRLQSSRIIETRKLLLLR
jgi:hypothetical protein